MCGDWLPIEAVHVDEVCRERVHTRHMRRRSVRHERRRRRLVRRVLDVGGGLQARVVGALLRLVRLVIALLLDPFLLSLLAKVVLVREDLRARNEMMSGEVSKKGVGVSTLFPAISANRAVRPRARPYLRRLCMPAVPLDYMLERRARVDCHFAIRTKRDQADLSVRKDGEFRCLLDHAHLPLAIGDLAVPFALDPLYLDLFAAHRGGRRRLQPCCGGMRERCFRRPRMVRTPRVSLRVLALKKEVSGLIRF